MATRYAPHFAPVFVPKSSSITTSSCRRHNAIWSMQVLEISEVDLIQSYRAQHMLRELIGSLRLYSETNIKNRQLKALSNCVQTLPSNVAETVHVQVNLQVI
eukprot:TRINITY_DN256_c0_g1_i8.p1 TRINITY_DN256_c0_g1~~TRINITY_DN256_c0_g1_i8.p1  ORF type:complete len:102 (+),score=0.96 TRINITY_DN256_c0_g1_i8:312-617(+)